MGWPFLYVPRIVYYVQRCIAYVFRVIRYRTLYTVQCIMYTVQWYSTYGLVNPVVLSWSGLDEDGVRVGVRVVCGLVCGWCAGWCFGSNTRLLYICTCVYDVYCMSYDVQFTMYTVLRKAHVLNHACYILTEVIKQNINLNTIVFYLYIPYR